MVLAQELCSRCSPNLMTPSNRLAHWNSSSILKMYDDDAMMEISSTSFSFLISDEPSDSDAWWRLCDACHVISCDVLWWWLLWCAESGHDSNKEPNGRRWWQQQGKCTIGTRKPTQQLGKSLKSQCKHHHTNQHEIISITSIMITIIAVTRTWSHPPSQKRRRLRLLRHNCSSMVQTFPLHFTPIYFITLHYY